MATISFSPATTYYYNDENERGGTGCYYGNNRKVRYNMTATNSSGEYWLQKGTIISAQLSIKITTHYNEKCYNNFYATTSNTATDVFPNGSNSGVVCDCAEGAQYATFYPTGTYYFDVTNVIKYAAENYGNNTWYLWHYTDNNSSEADKYTSPTITVTYEEGTKCYVYANGTWNEATPYVYNGGWKKATANVRANSTWN